jgi:hypothetical protein
MVLGGDTQAIVRSSTETYFHQNIVPIYQKEL